MDRFTIWAKPLTLMLFFFSATAAFAHGEEDHDKKENQEQQVEHVQDEHENQLSETHEHQAMMDKPVQAAFDDFPNLHPLLVHFPIVLLLLAALLAIANIIFHQKELDWVITLCTGLGALGAYAAGRWFHPHTHDLTDHMQAVLDQHDLYADWTIWLSIAAFVMQLISQFVVKQKRWVVVVVSLVLVGAAYSVSQAGHYGSQLVHIEGVGPQGYYLKIEEGHSH